MPQSVQALEAILSLPHAELDYARAKIALDRLVDPDTDESALLAELERMAKAARGLAGRAATDADKLRALRTLVYRSGPWNGGRPFAYDHQGFKQLRCKLLATYLDTRRGNCVSMPVLFLILADRLGLDVRLSFAPHHLFVRYRSGKKWINLEATGTALPARDAWYRQIMPMSDRAVASGFYLRTLGKRESVAAMATTVVEALSEQQRFDEVAAGCAVILRHNPRDGATWARQGHASYTLLWHEYLKKYPSAYRVPPHLRPRFSALTQQDFTAFLQAKRLGWEPPPEMAGLYGRFDGVGGMKA